MNWITSKLDDICQIEMGGTPDRANPTYWGGNNVWVSIADLSGLDESVICDSREKISDLGVKNSGAYPVVPGTLLMSFKLSIGRVAIAGTPLYTNEAIVALPIKKPLEIDTLFLYYALQAIDWSNSGQRAVKGITLNKPMLSQLEISYPPLAEQCRIAAILRAADDERRRRRYTQTLSGSLLGEVFVRMFGDPATNPLGWKVKPVGDYVTSMRNGLSPSSEGVCPGRVLTLTAITGDFFDSSEWKEGVFAGNYTNYFVDDGEFLVCRGNGNIRLVGRGKYPTRSFPDTIFPDTMIAVTFGNGLLPKFVEATWQQGFVRTQIEAGARTTNGTLKINQQVIEAIKIPVPPLEHQREFAAIVTDHEQTRRQQQESARQSDHLFETLLHRAFAGEL